jgi:hypothetical protein
MSSFHCPEHLENWVCFLSQVKERRHLVQWLRLALPKRPKWAGFSFPNLKTEKDSVSVMLYFLVIWNSERWTKSINRAISSVIQQLQNLSESTFDWDFKYINQQPYSIIFVLFTLLFNYFLSIYSTILLFSLPLFCILPTHQREPMFINKNWIFLRIKQ